MFLSSFSQAVFIFFCVEYFLRLATCWAVSAASAGVALRRVYLWEKPEAPLPEPSKPMQVRLLYGYGYGAVQSVWSFRRAQRR